MALREATRQRAYKGQCRSCKAPEMVLCKDDCKYEDPWADYYLGPKQTDRERAKKLRAEESRTRLSFVS